LPLVVRKIFIVLKWSKRL